MSAWPRLVSEVEGEVSAWPRLVSQVEGEVSAWRRLVSQVEGEVSDGHVWLVRWRERCQMAKSD